MNRRLLFLSTACSVFLELSLVAGAALAQPAPEIGLDPAIDCWFDSEFPVLGALVTPPEEIVTSRLYFRCSLYPDYYFVDLANDGGTFRGVAPQADPTCPRVHYYVEALSRDFTSARTEERVAEVASPNECRRRNPAVLWFGGSDPGIILGSLTSSGFAPGFKAIGIAGFLSSAGTTAAAGTATGGLSGGVVAGIAAGGGAAAGLAVLSTGSGSTTTTAPLVLAPPSTTTVPVTTTTPPAPQGVKACFRVDPPSGIGGVNDPFTFDGRCSEGDNLKFRYDLGDGRVKEGQPFISAVWSTAGTYAVTLTVTSDSSSLSARAVEDSVTREIVILDPVSANFTAKAVLPGPCTGEFDGTSSMGDIARYEWELDPNNELGFGAILLKGPIVSQDWKSACRVTNGTVVARLTVFGPDGSSDTLEKRVTIETLLLITRAESGAVESSLSSEMLESESARGQVVLEGASAHAVSSERPALVSYAGRSGQNRLDAVLASESSSPLLWRFDFRGARGFVPGSLRVVSGQEVARDAYSVVLRFSGSTGERARIEYRLE